MTRRRSDYLSIPCGICCRQRVRVLATDDQALSTERCPEDLRASLDAAGVATHGDRVLLQREDGYCEHLSDDLTHCLLVTDASDGRPLLCRTWADELCADLGCPKFEGKP